MKSRAGEIVVVHIDDRGKESGWFVGMIVQEVQGGYLARVSIPHEHRRPAYEMSKRKWYRRPMRATEEESFENEFQVAWSGWMELPENPVLVLFSRIASASFLAHLRERFGRKGTLAETVIECLVPASKVFSPNREKLYQVMFA